MLPPLEDSGLAQRANEGTYRLPDLCAAPHPRPIFATVELHS